MKITSVVKATNREDWQIRGIPLDPYSFNGDYESLTDEQRSKVTYDDSGQIFEALYENLPSLTFQKLVDRFVTYNRKELEKL